MNDLELEKLRETFPGYNTFDSICLFGQYVHASCKKYALSKMDKDDWITLEDANRVKTEDVIDHRKQKGKMSVAYTIKKSSSTKYGNFYQDKWITIMERITK